MKRTSCGYEPADTARAICRDLSRDRDCVMRSMCIHTYEVNFATDLAILATKDDMNYRSLAAHNAACNEIFRRFQDCENEHPYRRFLGYCGYIQREMNKCIKEQREIRRLESVQSGQLRRKRLEMNTQQESSD